MANVRGEALEAVKAAPSVGFFATWMAGVDWNATAAFLGARREDLPWLSLVGVVANEIANIPGERARPHERIAIGAGTRHDVARPGYLYAFANDAWGFYWNNSRSVRLTVTREQ